VKGVSPNVPPTTYVGQRVKGRRSEGVEQIITKSMTFRVDDFMMTWVRDKGEYE
jgi:hypothetical protein